MDLLKPVPFAHAFAATMAIFGLLMWFLASIAPALFATLWNAQFLGADAYNVVPPTTDMGTAITSIVVLAATGWVMGYLIAYFYNRFAK